MGYPTTAELIAASSGEARAALDALDEEQADALRQSAIDAVESFTRQSFTPEGTEADPVTKTVDGSGGPVLYLPKRLALLDEASLDGHLWTADEVTLDDLHSSVVLVSPIGGSWLTRVRRDPADTGPIWHRGTRNVSITGVWGWTDDEWTAGALAPVADAIRLDMEDQALADANLLASTVRSARSLGVESISQGSLSLTLRPGESALSIRAQRKLTRFRWRGQVGAVA